MYSYEAFGLLIRSPLELWPIESAIDGHREPDVEVVLSSALKSQSDAISLRGHTTETHVDGVCSLRVTGGTRIELGAEPEVDAATLASAATGPGLAILLHQRGLFVLHGSCARVGQRALCLCGPSGVGKSTLSSALLRRGHVLVSDGMTALELGSEGVRARRGPSCAKLWPDAAEHLGWKPETLLRVSPDHDKRVVPIPSRAPSSVALHTVFSVHAGEKPRVRLLAPGEAVVELLRQSFLIDWIDRESSAELLAQAGTMAASIDVAAFWRGQTLADLDPALQLLETALSPRARPG